MELMMQIKELETKMGRLQCKITDLKTELRKTTGVGAWFLSKYEYTGISKDRIKLKTLYELYKKDKGEIKYKDFQEQLIDYNCYIVLNKNKTLELRQYKEVM
jgi:hypothetical protein